MSDNVRPDVLTRFGMGNDWWKARSRHGRFPTFEPTPEGLQKLAEACEDYFTWNRENPLYEAKLVSYEGDSTLEEVPKMRAMSINGLCIFIDVAYKTWKDWRTTRPDLRPVIDWAEECIRLQKFEGAAAGFLNPTIIARDLGLADKQEVSGPNGGPIQQVTGEMSAQEAAEAYARTRDGR